MSKKRLYSYDRGNNKILCNLNDVCDFNVSNVFQLLNSLAEENEQLEKGKMEALSLLGEEIDKNEQLKKENEQLRQKLDFYLLDEFEWKEKYGD